MNGEYLKEIRVKSGLRQIDFAKILNCSQASLSKMERDELEITPSIVAIIEKLVDKETRTTLTDKKFSRALFLKNMLTGNEVIDNIYKEAKWLKELDREPVYSKGVRIILKTDNKVIHKYYKRLKGNNTKLATPTVREWEKQFVIFRENLPFYCREEWLK